MLQIRMRKVVFLPFPPDILAILCTHLKRVLLKVTIFPLFVVLLDLTQSNVPEFMEFSEDAAPSREHNKLAMASLPMSTCSLNLPSCHQYI
jgi:hypothetical protein